MALSLLFIAVACFVMAIRIERINRNMATRQDLKNAIASAQQNISASVVADVKPKFDALQTEIADLKAQAGTPPVEDFQAEIDAIAALAQGVKTDVSAAITPAPSA